MNTLTDMRFCMIVLCCAYCPVSLSAHVGWVWSARYQSGSSGSVFATAGQVRDSYKPHTQCMLTTRTHAHTLPVNVSFLSYAQCLLKDGSIKVWDTRSGNAVEKLREGGTVARALAWSRTKDHVLAAGELTVRSVYCEG